MLKESCEVSQLSFHLSVNAEDIHLGPVVDLELLTRVSIVLHLALGMVHDPCTRDSRRRDSPVRIP